VPQAVQEKLDGYLANQEPLSKEAEKELNTRKSTTVPIWWAIWVYAKVCLHPCAL
jgi:hypothetical protein